MAQTDDLTVNEEEPLEVSALLQGVRSFVRYGLIGSQFIQIFIDFFESLFDSLNPVADGF